MVVITVILVTAAIDGGTLTFTTLNLKLPLRAPLASDPYETSSTSLAVPVVNRQVSVEAVKPLRGRH